MESPDRRQRYHGGSRPFGASLAAIRSNAMFRIPHRALPLANQAQRVCRQSISDSWLGNLRECLAEDGALEDRSKATLDVALEQFRFAPRTCPSVQWQDEHAREPCVPFVKFATSLGWSFIAPSTRLRCDTPQHEALTYSLYAIALLTASALPRHRYENRGRCRSAPRTRRE